jgi:hypothetical protein
VIGTRSMSDVGNATVERLTLAVDELATAHPATPPAELLVRARAHLGRVRQRAQAP